MKEKTDDAINPAKPAYEAARRLTQDEQFGEALERQEWSHHHALEHDLSFASMVIARRASSDI